MRVRIGRIQELGVLIALGLLCFYLSRTTDTFFTSQNLLQVARQASYYGIMAVGMVFVIVMGDIDLSVGSILTLANVTTAMVLRDKGSIPLAILAGLATGAACGCLNGVLAVILRIPMIIVTLGTLSLFRGIALILSNGAPISQFSKETGFFTIGGGNVAGVPTSVWVMLIVCAAGWVWYSRTSGARSIIAIGSNPKAAFLSGIPIARCRIGVMTVNGIIASMAGIVALAFLQSADPSTGPGYELWVIASAIIGGTALSGGSGSVPGAVLGALIIAAIRNGLLLLGYSNFYSTAVTGVVIILAVAVDSLVKRRANAG